MSSTAKNLNQIYSYSDYLVWPEEESWELINGIAFSMSPAPSRFHQKILMELSRQFANYLKGKKCEVYSAPFDVRLNEKESAKDSEIMNVVQPDIVIVCDESKLDDKGCLGAPDLVVEILSPHTASKDVKEKFELYEKYQVKEYWIVHPTEKIFEIFLLSQQKIYQKPFMYHFDDEIKVNLFDDLIICLKDL